MNLQDYFIEVYEKNSWCSSESRSGPGSERDSILIKTACNAVVECINIFLRDKECIRISDVPCGDFNWIDILFQEIFSNTNCKKIEYYAYDIVPNIKNNFDSIIKTDNVEYNFNVLNAITDVVIESDILFSKEMFIHLSYKDITSCLVNFKKSKSTYMIFSDSMSIPNRDIAYSCLGECRDTSLMLEPFNLVPVLTCKNYLVVELADIKENNIVSLN